MSSKNTKYSYMEWFSAEEMHEQSKKWFSELSFIKDEQHFLNNLIQSFAIKSINQKEFEQIDAFKNAIAENQGVLNPMCKQIQKHISRLEIMTDGVNQLVMEQAYKKAHKRLYLKMNTYLSDYRAVKEKGFVHLAAILKSNKEKIALGNPEYKIKTTSHES